MIKILIVDDSPTETILLRHIFEAEKDFFVVGCAKNGNEAISLTEKLKPDIITMDIEMPEMNGVEATKVIMSHFPTPIVMISSHLNNKEVETTFLALDAGALSVLDKPASYGSSEFEKSKKRIADTVRNMAGIKVIKRRFFTKKTTHLSTQLFRKEKTNYKIIAIGTSVGGPQALKIILSHLPTDFPVPIVVVQHMTPGFMTGFVNWLDMNIALTAKEMTDGEVLKAGVVYFAPDHVHSIVNQKEGKLISSFIKCAPVSGFCPSVTVLLESVAKSCGKEAVGLLLTGMGNDGAQGLLAMKKAEAHTLIQDEKSAIVFGMGGVAKSLGAVDEVIKLDQIADYLKGIV